MERNWPQGEAAVYLNSLCICPASVSPWGQSVLTRKLTKRTVENLHFLFNIHRFFVLEFLDRIVKGGSNICTPWPVCLFGLNVKLVKHVDANEVMCFKRYQTLEWKLNYKFYVGRFENKSLGLNTIILWF